MKRAVLVIIFLRLSMIARMVANGEQSSCHGLLDCLYMDPVVTLLDLFVIGYIIYRIGKRIIKMVNKKDNDKSKKEKSHKNIK